MTYGYASFLHTLPQCLRSNRMLGVATRIPRMKPNCNTLEVFVATLLLFLTCGCSSIADAQRLSWLNTADPKHECEAAIARGDLRFYAVNGIASDMILGTDQHGADRALIQVHGFRIIAGTSDHSNIRLNQRASEYVRYYNATLLRYLRAKSRNA